MEAQWAASEYDFNNLFADKTSFAAYKRQRMRRHFETVPSAEDRRAHETTIERCSVSEDGAVQNEEVKVEGWIIPKMDLKRRILKDHEDKRLSDDMSPIYLQRLQHHGVLPT